MNEQITISVIGAGGIGNPLVFALMNTLTSKAEIQIFDYDYVAISNLPRQIFFSQEDLDKNKAEVLSQTLQDTNEKIKLKAFPLKISAKNIEEHLLDSDIVIDATDSVETKFLINDFCVNNKIIFCYAGAVSYEGQFLLCNPSNQTNGCLRCLFGDFSIDDFNCQNTTCQQAGILGPITGFVGFAVANKISEYLTDHTILADASIFYRLELEKNHLFSSKIKASADCPFCSVKDNLNSLDIRTKKCPSTFLYSKMAIEKLNVGQRLEVRTADEKIAENITRSLFEEGHKVVSAPKLISEHDWRVILERGV